MTTKDVMKKLFKATGTDNSDDLLDYINELNGKKNEPKEAMPITVLTDEVIEFTGNRKEFVEYCYSRGVKSDYDYKAAIDIECWMYALARATGAKRIILHYVGKRMNSKTGEAVHGVIIKELDTTYHNGLRSFTVDEVMLVNS